MHFGGIKRFFSDATGNAKDKFTTRKTKRRMIGESIGVHGLQTIVIKKFQGYHDTEKCWKKVEGNNVIQRVGIWNSIVICKDEANLLTDAGRDLIHTNGWTNGAGANTTRGAGYIVLSENTGGASASHTAVAGEISTNGLARADATTKTHTTGTNTSTVQHTFTALAAFTALQLSGLLNAASTGTLMNEKTFTSTALDTNDQIQVTWTITAG